MASEETGFGNADDKREKKTVSRQKMFGITFAVLKL